MSARWAAVIPRASVAFAGALRLKAIEVCDAGERLWLRGSGPLEGIRTELAALPGSVLFELAADGRITPPGQKVPTARLPEGSWTPLAELLTLAMPEVLLPAETGASVTLRVLRSTVERAPNVLITDAYAWRDFALAASSLRLKPLKFALSETQALIWGTPLPPIAGTPFAEEHGLAVPCGFALHPISDPEVLRPLLRLEPGDLALFQEDGTFEVVESGLFVSATRSAVRQSLPTNGSATT